MGSLFSRRPQESKPLISSNPTQITTPNDDSISYVENMLARSGGDAKAAFYLAAQEKGIDPDQFIKRLSSVGDSKTMLQSMLSSNPRIGKLLSLFSMIK